MRYSRLFRRSLAAVVALWSVAGADLTYAQDGGRPSSAAPIVTVNGTGGEIDVAGASVTITGSANRVWAAGARVDINADVTGPVRAVGADLTIAGNVAGSLRAGGGIVEASGSYGQDVYVGAAVVRFNAAAAGDVSLAAAAIETGPLTVVEGELSAAAADITVAGKFTGTVRLAGAAVTFNGAAAGDVIADASQAVVGPGATIGGNLIVRSHAAPIIGEGAKITGQVIIEEPSHWSQVPLWLWTILFAVFMAAGAVLTAIVLLIFGRGGFETAVDRGSFRPLSSGLIGLGVIVLLPIAASILMATVIGLSVGIAVLLLLPFLLVAGHAVAATSIGLWIVDRSGGPWSPGRLILFSVVGGIVLALVWLIPWAGHIVLTLALLVGVGSFFRAVGARVRRGWTQAA